MPHSFRSVVDVAAPPDLVWATLLRTDRWTAWDDALAGVDGALVDGGRITIRVHDQPRPFRLRVVDRQPPGLLVLRGGLPLGLFRGTRQYRIAESPVGSHVTMAETYTGPLAPLIGRSIPDLQPSFDRFVAGWRDDAEAAATAGEEH